MIIRLERWERADLDVWRRHAKRLSGMTDGAGRKSDRFNRVREDLLKAAKNGTRSLCERINDRMDVRAVADILSSKRDHRHIQLEPRLVERLSHPSPFLTSITLTLLITAYCNHYDSLGTPSGLKALAKLIREQLASGKKRRGGGSLRVLAKNIDLVFYGNAPRNISQKARKLSKDTPPRHRKAERPVAFRRAVRECGLDRYRNGRLAALAMRHYFVDSLNSIKVGANSPLLAELWEPSNAGKSGTGKYVYEDTYSDTRLRGHRQLGHEVLSILIGRADEDHISEAWRRTITRIAGDPRIQGEKYRNWWGKINKEYVKKAKRWFIGFDLRLFLKAIEQYGRAEGDRALLRMYLERKNFLEGLVEQNVIEESRLFINPSMGDYLKRHFKPKELPEYDDVNAGGRSIIYMKIGRVHLLEGSHNRAVYGLPWLPKGSKILDPKEPEFDHRYLDGKRWAEEGEREAKRKGRKKPPLRVVHRPSTNFVWQRKIIDYLRKHGVKLSLEPLFSAADYKKFKRMYDAD